MPQNDTTISSFGKSLIKTVSRKKPNTRTLINRYKIKSPITMRIAMLLPVFFDRQKAFNSCRMKVDVMNKL